MRNMTKKHYDTIAEVLRLYVQNGRATQRHMVEDLADYFATDNPKFQRDKFLAACGIETWLDKYSKQEQDRYLETVKKHKSQT